MPGVQLGQNCDTILGLVMITCNPYLPLLC